MKVKQNNIKSGFLMGNTEKVFSLRRRGGMKMAFENGQEMLKKVFTLRRRGGMKVKATQAAISRPATTALIDKSRGTVRIRKDCIFFTFLLFELSMFILIPSLDQCTIPS